MRNLLPLLLLFSALATNVCHAQANAIEIVCTECRDPVEYPDDFVNFAFNQVFGRDGWLTPEQADDFFVSNLDGHRVYIDIDFVFLGIGIRGFRLPLWPANMVQITLALPNGEVYETLRSVFLTPLPVPASREEEHTANPGDGSPSAAGGGDGDDDHNDAEESDSEDPEIDDPVGIVEIEDPDENGDFDDTDWCEEC